VRAAIAVLDFMTAITPDDCSLPLWRRWKQLSLKCRHKPPTMDRNKTQKTTIFNLL